MTQEANQIRPSRDAGSLYNVLSDGRSMFALVDDGQITDLTYHHSKPDDGRTWLPVVFEDSEAFDTSKHWRLPPVSRIDGDRVVRLFQVVPKSWEYL
jgi:hypothetical protein